MILLPLNELNDVVIITMNKQLIGLPHSSALARKAFIKMSVKQYHTIMDAAATSVMREQ